MCEEYYRISIPHTHSICFSWKINSTATCSIVFELHYGHWELRSHYRTGFRLRTRRPGGSLMEKTQVKNFVPQSLYDFSYPWTAKKLNNDDEHGINY
jgi:hypothetical protein